MKNSSPHDDFESALRRDAARLRERAIPSDDLAQRITREVHRSRLPAAAQPARNFWRLPLISFAGLAACAALAFMMLQPEPATSDPGTVPPGSIAISNSTGDSAPAPAELWAAIKPEAQALLAQDPLQSEVDAVVSDARSALQFLALNFLPTASPETPAQRG
jgi:hypothetical protein